MEYSIFVKKVEEFAAEPDITTEQAVCKAVDYCIDHDVMKEFMEVHREEVSNMFTEEFDFDRAIEVSREEAREAGRDDEKKANVIEMLKDNLPLNKIAQYTRLTVDQVMSIGKNAALL